MYKSVENASKNVEEFDSQTTSIIISKWAGQHALSAKCVESDNMVSQLLLYFSKKDKKNKTSYVNLVASITDTNIRAQRINKFRQT